MPDISQVNHATEATGGDSDDQVSVSEWNAGHVLIGVPVTSKRVVTNAELLALHTTEVEIVQAPGTGKFIVPVSVHAAFKYGSAPFSTVGDNYPTLSYAGFGIVFDGIFGILGLTNDRQQPHFALTGSGMLSGLENLGLTLQPTNGAMTGGVGCSLTVWVSYLTLDLP